MNKYIKILVVEDSPVVRDYLVYLFSSDPELHVVGTASNGYEAIDLVKKKKPDIITMDIEMPKMNGLEATRIIMQENPTPIVLVSSSFDINEVNQTFAALEAGALSIMAKPMGIQHPQYSKLKNDLIKTIKLMSEVKVVTRRSKYLQKKHSETNEVSVSVDENNTNYKLVAIGVSTGGPQILQNIFSNLPTTFKIPIVVVQHIPEGFLEGMIVWLNKSSKLPINIAKQSEKPIPGNIYFAPAEMHLSIDQQSCFKLIENIPLSNIRPSVSHLFRSVGKYFGSSAIGILLSGMGKDGAEELRMMKERGSLTIIQDEETSVVFGMPAEAQKLNAHKYILPPSEIVRKLIQLNK